MSDRQASTVGLVATVGDDHGRRAHDRSLGDGVQRRDEQNHLGEDEENARDEKEVLPGVGAPSVLGLLVLSDLGGNRRGIRRVSEDVARDDGESRLVNLTDVVPGHRSRTCDVPDSLSAPGNRETIKLERAITDDRPIRAGNNLVNDDASREKLSSAILGDSQRQGERVTHLGLERPSDIVGDDGMIGGEGTALSARIHARGIERGRLGTRVDRVARSVLRREMQLIESIDRDQLVPRRHPVGEGAGGNRDFLIRGRLR